jgi:indolepyruvate decarboxylase
MPALEDDNFSHFTRMAKEVTVSQTCLAIYNAEVEIDRLLATALFKCHPGYLGFPAM